MELHVRPVVGTLTVAQVLHTALSLRTHVALLEAADTHQRGGVIAITRRAREQGLATWQAIGPGVLAPAKECAVLRQQSWGE